MRKSRFSEAQMVAILRNSSVAEVAKKHAISERCIYTWREHFGDIDANAVKRLRQLEVKNGRLKKLVAERDLEIAIIKEIAARNGEHTRPSAARGPASSRRPLAIVKDAP